MKFLSESDREGGKGQNLGAADPKIDYKSVICRRFQCSISGDDKSAIGCITRSAIRIPRFPYGDCGLWSHGNKQLRESFAADSRSQVQWDPTSSHYGRPPRQFAGLYRTG
jgi:hypothetical protein